MNSESNGNGNGVILRCQDVWKIYEKDGKQFPVCCRLNFDVYENEFLCIVGPTGSGKSTILKMIAGFEKPSIGAVTVWGEPVKAPGKDRGMIFQEYAMLPWRTVKQNIELGMELRNDPPAVKKEKCAKYLNMVGLDYAKDRYPYECSGGMKRRMTLAMILAINPKILLMDGAFNALDAKTKMTMQTEIVDIWRKERTTIVFVTAELDEAVKLSDRIIVLNRCGCVEKTIHNTLPRPRHGKAAQKSEFLRKFVALREEVFVTLKKATFAQEPV